MDFVKLHKHILALDPKIRFTIFDTNGKIVQSGHHEGLTGMLTKAESKKSINIDPFSVMTKITKLVQKSMV